MLSLLALGFALRLTHRGIPDERLRKAFQELEDEWAAVETRLKKELGRISRLKREVTEVAVADPRLRELVNSASVPLPAPPEPEAAPEPDPAHMSYGELYRTLKSGR